MFLGPPKLSVVRSSPLYALALFIGSGKKAEKFHITPTAMPHSPPYNNVKVADPLSLSNIDPPK